MYTVDDGMKQTIDIVSLTTAFGTLMGVLPSIAAVFSIIWSVVRIYESQTFQGLLARWRQRNK